MDVTKKRLAALKEEKAQADTEKQWAWEHAAEVYRERDLLVRALSKQFPAHLTRHRGNGNKKPVVCIHAPAGQMCWTLPSDEFAQEHYRHLQWSDNDWDGHKTVDRYKRLEAL